MNKLILLAAILSAGAIGASSLSLDPAYFGPEYREPLNKPEGQDLLEAIGALPGAMTAEGVRKNLKRSAVREPENSKRKLIYEVLSDMANLDELCSYGMKLVEYYLMTKELYAQMKADTPRDWRLSRVESMVNYLDWNAGSGKFKLCFHHFRGQMERLIDMTHKENDRYRSPLDQLMCNGYDLGDPVEPDDLFRAARDFDFADGVLLRALLRSTRGRYKGTRSERLLQYLDDICIPAESTLNSLGILDLYNIARATGSVHAPIQLRKLNEYHRICLSVTDPEKRKKTRRVIEGETKGGCSWLKPWCW